MQSQPVVAIGASAGGVEALKALAAQMPRDFPLPLLVVLHIGKRPSILPEILANAGPLGASHARQGEALRPGHFHVAPPDHHMILEDGRIALTHGPKEHHARPAIDPLFRSSAITHGAATVAVVLSGLGEDGTAGLGAVKACGGTTIVQEPSDAVHAGMPASALRYGLADQCTPVAALGAILCEAVKSGGARAHACPARVLQEHELFLGRGQAMDHLRSIAKPSPYVCPECKGGLWDLDQGKPRRYRCHTGHAHTLRTLQHAQSEETDAAIWGAIRGLQEEAMLLREMARASLDEGDSWESTRLEMSAAAVQRQSDRLRELVERAPDDVTADSPRIRNRSG